jgi:hypothetical protein
VFLNVRAIQDGAKSPDYGHFPTKKLNACIVLSYRKARLLRFKTPAAHLNFVWKLLGNPLRQRFKVGMAAK